MITHYIITSSSYTKGKRIALDYVINGKNDFSKFNGILEKIIEKCGKDVSISTHFIQTDSTTWKSVKEKDYFFEDVELIESIDEFIELIQNDRLLVGLDVAKYILCKIRCTHLKLEKIVYFCYAEYLCKYNKELFKDSIFAYKYGPVIDSVYKKYRRYGYKEIEYDSEDIDSTDLYEMPSRSRILFAEDGINKIKVIDETIIKYGKLSAEDLVSLTHRELTPWSLSGKGEYKNEIIENNIIKLFHCNEEIIYNV